MPDHVQLRKIRKSDALDVLKYLTRVNQARYLSSWQVDLRHIARYHRLAVKAEPGEEHFHLLDRGVLRLVQDYERVVQGATAHESQRSNLDRPLLQQLAAAIGIHQIVESVVERSK